MTASAALLDGRVEGSAVGALTNAMTTGLARLGADGDETMLAAVGQVRQAVRRCSGRRLRVRDDTRLAHSKQLSVVACRLGEHRRAQIDEQAYMKKQTWLMHRTDDGTDDGG
jgi:hypothetical protein